MIFFRIIMWLVLAGAALAMFGIGIKLIHAGDWTGALFIALGALIVAPPALDPAFSLKRWTGRE